MKQYSYKGKKKYEPVWPYLAGMALLVVLTFWCWFEFLAALEHSMIELPAPTSVVEVRG